MNNINNFNEMSDEEKFIFLKDNEIELIFFGDGLIDIFNVLIDTNDLEPIYQIYSRYDDEFYPISDLKYIENCRFKLIDEDGEYFNLFAVKLIDALDIEGNVKDLK